jgi:polyhydroxybutyrate depolymerase
MEEMIYADFRPLADAHSFLIVAPDGQGTDQHFNLTGEPGLQDDVAFVVALLDHVQTTFCVDTRRVFSTGMSDGGAMTSVLACLKPDRFAAFGAVAVVVHVPGCVARPLPIMAFTGTADPIVPFNGGKVNCCGNPTLGAAPDAMAAWAAQDNCRSGPTDTRLGTQVRLREWSACGPRAAVEYYIIDGGGHTWPGSAIAVPGLGLTTTQVKATDLIWAFFQAHPLT